MTKILLLYYGLFCSVLSLKHYVFGQEINENENLNITIKRYLIEDDFKPAIFGSYKYDPVKNSFDLPDGILNEITTTISTDTKLRQRGRFKRKDHSTLLVNYGRSTTKKISKVVT